MIDFLGTLFIEVLLWPAEWLTEQLWKLYPEEGTAARFFSAIALGLVTVVIWVTWIGLLIGIPVAIIYLASKN